jgi:integrase
MHTAQRIDAILGLKWGQIQHGVIDFNVGTVKRQKRRGVIPVIPAIQAVLDGCTSHPEYVIADDWRRVGYHKYLHEWQRVCKVAGVKDATPHCVRHGVATALIAAGVPLLEVSKMLGHVNSRITETVYAKFAPGYTLGATEKMGGWLK